MSNYKTRNRARYYAIQALYQQNFVDISIEKQKIEFYQNNFFRATVEWDFFNILIEGVQKNKIFIENVVNNSFTEKNHLLGYIESSILKLGCFELVFFPEIPYKVVLNEYIKKTKIMGNFKSYMLINKILDRIFMQYCKK